MTTIKFKKFNIEAYQPGKSTIKSFNKIIKLSANESALGVSAKAKKAISNKKLSLFRYPDGKSKKLRSQISKKFSCDKEKIICGAGSDEVILPQFSFLMYRIYAKIVGAKVVFAKEKNFKVSVSEIIKKVSNKTKIVFLANPNNPTGTYLNSFELIDLRKRLRKNTLLVVDDAYAEYMQNRDYKSGLDLFKNKQNVFILRTFSKIYGLSSLRIGWGYGSKKIIDALNVIKPPFNVNEVAQKAAIESLKDKKFISRSVKHNHIYATKLKNFLSNYDISSNKVSANFLLLNFNKCKLRANSFYEKLKKKGIILRSTEEGYKIKNMLRLTIGSKEENMKFIKATQNIFRR